METKYLNGTGKTAYDGTICKTVDEEILDEDFIVHPAFTLKDNNGSVERELDGIWMDEIKH